MNNVEFIRTLTMEYNLQCDKKEKEMTQKDMKSIVDLMQDIVYKEMAAEGEVKLFNGLTLEGVKKEARQARNPKTGETIEIASKLAPKAKFGAACKNALNPEC